MESGSGFATGDVLFVRWNSRYCPFSDILETTLVIQRTRCKSILSLGQVNAEAAERVAALVVDAERSEGCVVRHGGSAHAEVFRSLKKHAARVSFCFVPVYSVCVPDSYVPPHVPPCSNEFGCGFFSFRLFLLE